MAENEPDDGDEILKGPSLSADGRLDRFAKVEDPVTLNPPPIAAQHEPPLELQVVAPPPIEPRVEVFRQLPPSREEKRRSLALKIVIALVVLGIGGAVALVVIKPKLGVGDLPDGVTESSLFAALKVGEAQPLIINSEPSGAKILIGGKEVGETPWAGENRWSGKVKYQLVLKGYQRFEGQFDGEQPVTLDVQLKK